MEFRYVAVILAVIVVVALGGLLLMHKAGGGNSNSSSSGGGVTTSTVGTSTGTSTITSVATSTTTSTTTINGTATNTSTVVVTSDLTITFKQINSTWYEFIIPYPKVNYLLDYYPNNHTFVVTNVSWYDVVTGTPIYDPSSAKIVVPTPQYFSVYNGTALVWPFWFTGNNFYQSTFTKQDYKFVGNDLIIYAQTYPGFNFVPGKTYTFMLMSQTIGYAAFFNATYVQ